MSKTRSLIASVGFARKSSIQAGLSTGGQMIYPRLHALLAVSGHSALMGLGTRPPQPELTTCGLGGDDVMTRRRSLFAE